ncbi:hypothetical protein [Paenibacillus thalictri]|uniref:3-hydroxyanthranilate 3,4-dioxygenase n=1 Tax=Paenibacillus thalictri TaxID=2527873 RepID=A0A4Q9DJX1_9BACL|nr:hypothetical protein [Paenibacillus thalictri]TBL73341.1 hypothetical protein EYB31_27065 [Paenibacillus thalictri]
MSKANLLKMHEDIKLTTMENGYQGWVKVGQYIIWAKEYAASAPALTVLEKIDKGVVVFNEETEYLVHRIPAGTPVHITNLFGFWHTSDADRIWICAKYPHSKYHMIISGGNFGVNTVSIVSWFCPKCGHELARFEDKNPDEGPDFWDVAAEHVNTFNNSAEMRTCGPCGHVHPQAYPFVHDEDREPAERW